MYHFGLPREIALVGVAEKKLYAQRRMAIARAADAQTVADDEAVAAAARHLDVVLVRVVAVKVGRARRRCTRPKRKDTQQNRKMAHHAPSGASNAPASLYSSAPACSAPES